jgi:hypothetical protein
MSLAASSEVRARPRGLLSSIKNLLRKTPEPEEVQSPTSPKNLLDSDSDQIVETEEE